MPNFTGNNLEIQINPELNEDEKLHVFVTHDETTFQANDGLEAGWMPNGEHPLRKKGHGRSLHVSRLKLNSEQIDGVGENFPMRQGSRDGYWN